MSPSTAPEVEIFSHPNLAILVLLLMATRRQANPLAAPRPESLLRRSWHAMSDLFSPFSSSALATLPAPQRPVRYTRTDGIPETEADAAGQRPPVRNYLSINQTTVPPLVRVPKKIATPIRVEAKVWFANERTWVAWLNIAILLGTLALALFNASKDQIARNFAYLYALISLGVVVYGYTLYQHRITKIRKRDPGHFDVIAGPVIISALLFLAILANFLIRVRELREKNFPIPGADLYYFLVQSRRST